MADSESDRIAKMLHALSSGEHTEDESQKQEHHDDNIFGTPPQAQPVADAPRPATPTPVSPRPVVAKPAAPAVKPVVVPKVVVAKPTPAAPPKPVVQAPRPVSTAPQPVQAGSSVAPRAVAPALPKARPLATPRPGAPAPLPPQPVARPAPLPVPAPAPESVEEEADLVYAEPAAEQPAEAVEDQAIVSDDAAAGEETYDADDQMEMPAVPTSVLAHRPKKPIYKRKHMVQTLGFKQALIPISFTMFVVCITYVMIGFAANENSPFAALRSPFVAVPFGLVGLAMLATCIVTVGQVKHEMAAKQPEQPQAGHTA